MLKQESLSPAIVTLPWFAVKDRYLYTPPGLTRKFYFTAFGLQLTGLAIVGISEGAYEPAIHVFLHPQA